MAPSADPCTGGSPTYRSALRTRTFRLMLTAHGVGTVGQLMLTLAVGLEVLSRTGSGWWLSVTVALGFAPYVVASGFAGMLADRHSRSAVLGWSLGIRAACAAGLAVGLPLNWPVPVLVAVAAAAAFAATPAYPALAAATVHSVPDEVLPAANALLTGVVNLTWMAGPGLLGVALMFGGGPAVGTAMAAGLFLVACLVALRVRLDPPDRSGANGGTWSGLRAGARAVARSAAIRRPMTVAVVDNFLYGYVVVAAVMLARTSDGGEGMVGEVNAALSVGGLLAVLCANVIGRSVRPTMLLLLAVATFAAAVIVMAVSPWSRPAVVLACLAGVTTLLAEVTAVTLVQGATSDELTARVFGIYDQLNVGAIAAGSLIAGPLADRFGARPAMVLVAAGCLIVGVTLSARIRDSGNRGRHAAAGSAVRRHPRHRSTVAVTRPLPARPIDHRPEPTGHVERRSASRSRP